MKKACKVLSSIVGLVTLLVLGLVGMRLFLWGPPLTGSSIDQSPDGMYTSEAKWVIEEEFYGSENKYYILTITRNSDGAVLRHMHIPHTQPEDFIHPRSRGPFKAMWAPDSDSVTFGHYLGLTDGLYDSIVFTNIKKKDAEQITAPNP